MRRLFTVIVLLMIFAMLGAVVWVSNHLDSFKPPAPHQKKPAERTTLPVEKPVPVR